MDSTGRNPAETAIDAAAATLLAGAVGFACGRSGVADPLLSGAAALAIVLAGLRLVPASERRLPLAAFETVPLEPFAAEVMDGAGDELLLDQPLAQAGGTDDALLLDDALERADPESRVVRLFDPAAMPTAGQLHASIDAHLRAGLPASAPPDAAQALTDALRDLRRSLG